MPGLHILKDYPLSSYAFFLFYGNKAFILIQEYQMKLHTLPSTNTALIVSIFNILCQEDFFVIRS